jgi:dolichol-phosphate mannosyltransferase
VLYELKSLPEKTRFLRGMIPWIGFKQVGIAIDRDAREVGESTYTLRKLVALALDGLLSFSLVPLLAIPFVGLAIFLVGLFLLMAAALTHSAIFLMMAIFAVLTGIQVFCTGCVAVYLSKVLDEVRARPTYVISKRFGLARESEEIDNDDLGEPLKAKSNSGFESFLPATKLDLTQSIRGTSHCQHL